MTTCEHLLLDLIELLAGLTAVEDLGDTAEGGRNEASRTGRWTDLHLAAYNGCHDVVRCCMEEGFLECGLAWRRLRTS